MYDIVALTETSFSHDVSSSELFPDEYNGKFYQIEKVRGGGVLLAVKNLVKVELVPTVTFDQNFPSIDLLIVKIICLFILLFIFGKCNIRSLHGNTVELYEYEFTEVT